MSIPIILAAGGYKGLELVNSTAPVAWDMVFGGVVLSAFERICLYQAVLALDQPSWHVALCYLSHGTRCAVAGYLLWN